MLYPECLKKGDTIGITAPSAGGVQRPVDAVVMENAKQNLKQLGYATYETENVRKTQKLVSSSGEERAKEFYELYHHSHVKHIIAATGGEFLMEMLPYLDQYSFTGKTPKWVQGFSDVSLLLFYFTTKYQIATIHASNLGGYGRKKIHPAFLQSLAMVAEGEQIEQESYAMFEKTPINWQEGKEMEPPALDTPVVYQHLYEKETQQLQGRLIGGCVDVLKTVIGTPYDNTVPFCSNFSEGMLWYLENCELNVCDLYRALWQMREAGWFRNANGILMGRTRSMEAVHEYRYEDALHDAFDSLQIPVIYDIDVGHTNLQWTMINGCMAKFTYEKGKGRMVQQMLP